MFLLDTNVISEMRKYGAGRAAPGVITWSQSVPEHSLHLSSIVIQEIEIGILQLEWRKDRDQARIVRAWLEDALLPRFANRVLSVDVAVARRSAQLHVPDVRQYRDGLIAATALVYGMTLVTRNTKDFEGTGVHVLNPWIT